MSLGRMIRNSGWNLAGQSVPMVSALVAIPILIHRLGDSRFGFLSIAWMLAGYFSLLDLGIGRALTHGISKRLAHDMSVDTADLAWTGLTALGAFGAVGALVIALASHWVVYSVITINGALRPEAWRALLLLAAVVPLVVVSAGLRGILEAHRDFRSINLLQMPLGSLLFLAPLAVIQFSQTLPAVILSLLVVRLAGTTAFFCMCLRRIPGFLRFRVSRTTLKELLSFGGWMTVTNIVSPLMVNMDRLFIGSRLTVAAVTYYVTPFEIISKLLLISGAIANASFPEFTRLARRGENHVTRPYLLRTVGLTLVLVAPAALLAAVFAPDILRLWVSNELAARSSGVMRLLAVGMIVNGSCSIPFVYIQGTGRSDVTAKFHIIELVLYVPALLFAISRLGLIGVAVAWVLRVLLDALFLFSYAWWQLRPGVELPVAGGPPFETQAGQA